MKKGFYFILFTAILAFPLKSYANLNGFEIRAVVAWNDADDECAVQGEITSDEGGLINGSERLEVNGATWGDFSGLPLSGYNIGDKIAFGTLKLGLKLNYNFDVELDEGICQNLKLGDKIQFIGSFGDTLVDFDLFQPMILGGTGLDNNDTYVPLDLSMNSLWLTNLNGDMITLGSGPLFPGGGGGGGMGTGDGCSLSQGHPGAKLSWLGLFLLTVGGWALLAKRA